MLRYPATLTPPAYKGLVFSRWMRSLRHGNDYFRLIRPDAYYNAYDRYIELLTANPETVCRFAVLSDSHDVVLGFSVVRLSVLHYVHVHKDYRRLGVAKSLVPEGIDTITHLTKSGMSIWGSRKDKWAFNPFA